MEAVGARLSRSSTRYGPVSSSSSSFSGPVRKWHKAWVPLAGAGGAGSSGIGSMGVSRGNKVVLFKWTPVNGASGGAGDGKEAAAAGNRRRYVPRRVKVRSLFRRQGARGQEKNTEIGDN